MSHPNAGRLGLSVGCNLLPVGIFPESRPLPFILYILISRICFASLTVGPTIPQIVRAARRPTPHECLPDRRGSVGDEIRMRTSDVRVTSNLLIYVLDMVKYKNRARKRPYYLILTNYSIILHSPSATRLSLYIIGSMPLEIVSKLNHDKSLFR